jgi:hypothetical protein
MIGIEEAPRPRIASRARTAVDKYRSLAIGIATLLKIDFVGIRHPQMAAVIGLNFRVQPAPV